MSRRARILLPAMAVAVLMIISGSLQAQAQSGIIESGGAD